MIVRAQDRTIIADALFIDEYGMNDAPVQDSVPKLLSDVSPADSIKLVKKEDWARSGIYKFKPTQLIVPVTFITVGVVGLDNNWIIKCNRGVRHELQGDGHGKLTIDDFLQFAPAVAVYGLNLCGVEGVHNFGERTIILGTAALLTSATVYSIKWSDCEKRPDSSAHNSFPSGHTAFAFMGAEFLRREYWNVSPWIGVSGYVVAATTGFLRMYNNRHWLTDVLAGAGIGILSTEVAYWLYPYISQIFYPSKRHGGGLSVAPMVSPQFTGLSCQIVF